MVPRPVRVVYLDHCARLSGAEISLARLLPALSPGVAPLVLLGEDGPLVQRLQDLGVRVEVLPLGARVGDVRKDSVGVGASSLRAAVGVVPYVLALARRLRSEQPDLVHTVSLKAALYGGVAARLARVPMVWHLHDRVAPDYLPRAAVRLVRLALRLLPVAVVANSRSTLATAGVGRRGFVVDNVVVPEEPLPPRAEHPVSDGLVVGVLGRLTPWKGQQVFLEAFARAFRGTATRAHLIGAPLFGEEAFEEQLRASARDLGIEAQVDFRGFREDVFDELRQLDVLVHCSTTPEPFGQVVVEGMSVGLAVVASAEGGPAEVLSDGVDGVLVTPRDPGALSEVLVRLAADPGLRRELGRRARESSRRFTPSRGAAGVQEVYRSVLAGPSAAG